MFYMYKKYTLAKGLRRVQYKLFFFHNIDIMDNNENHKVKSVILAVLTVILFITLNRKASLTRHFTLIILNYMLTIKLTLVMVK